MTENIIPWQPCGYRLLRRVSRVSFMIKKVNRPKFDTLQGVHGIEKPRKSTLVGYFKTPFSTLLHLSIRAQPEF
jgi:hypothetical protein